MHHSRRQAFVVLLGAVGAIALFGCQAGQGVVDDAATADAPAADEPAAPASLSTEEARRLSALLDEGEAQYERGRWLDAAQSFSSALTIDPANGQALAGLNRSLARVDQQGRLDETAKLLELRSAAAIAEFDAGYLRSLQALDNGQFELARGALLQARAILVRNRDIIPVPEFESRDARAAELLDSIDSVQELGGR